MRNRPPLMADASASMAHARRVDFRIEERLASSIAGTAFTSPASRIRGRTSPAMSSATASASRDASGDQAVLIACQRQKSLPDVTMKCHALALEADSSPPAVSARSPRG